MTDIHNSVAIIVVALALIVHIVRGHDRER